MAFTEGRAGVRAALFLAGGSIFVASVWGLPGASAVAVVAAVLGLLVYAMVRVRDVGAAWAEASRLVLGAVYVPLLLPYIPALRAFEDGLGWIFLLLAATWLGDTGGYLAGRAFGRHKLFERVSPKKTWEGVAGGVVLAAAGACVVKAIGLPGVGWGHAIALGVVLDAAGVLGDLAESMLKRSFGVKDSGTIMPGHGGMLDRVDSLLFSAPVAWMYARAFGLW
jgi:phosphatidate cytidylyltransferase